MENNTELPEGEKIIEIDKDTEIEDAIDEKGKEIYDPITAYIEIAEAPFTVFEYLRRLEQGKIIVQPDFQRNQVWKHEQKSRFIESVLLNYPLPPIYLNETIDAKYIVIDGLQRTTTLNEYYKGQYKLKGTLALPMYEGFAFKELPENLQSKFEDKKINIYILKPSTPLPVIYDLFNRINTGGTPLNKQEIRNCIYIGKSTDLLKSLSEQHYFGEAIDWGVKGTRMKDREVVLRYIAFRWFDFQSEYNGDMSEYLENSMKRINKLNDEKINEIIVDFERTMKISFNIWGNRNFRLPTGSTRGSINTAILESVCYYLSFKSDVFIEKNKNIIKSNYTKLIQNKEYLDAVTRSTGNKSRVITRFGLVKEILNDNTNDK